MSALYVLIGFSLLVALLFLWAFFWAMRNDQYADTHTPAMRILFDNGGNAPTTRSQNSLTNDGDTPTAIRSQDSSSNDGNTPTTTHSQDSLMNDRNTSTTTPLQDSSTEVSQ